LGCFGAKRLRKGFGGLKKGGGEEERGKKKKKAGTRTGLINDLIKFCVVEGGMKARMDRNPREMVLACGASREEKINDSRKRKRGRRVSQQKGASCNILLNI